MRNRATRASENGRNPKHLSWLVGAATIGLALLAHPAQGDDSTGLTPLIDFQPGQRHQGYPGGLYPRERNFDWGGHLFDGLMRGLAVRPLDANGQPASNGRIVLLSVGMSNTSQESDAFRQLLTGFADRNPALVFVNGAQGGQDARRIADPNAPFWTNIDARLAQMGLTPLQVQAIWYKEAIAGPDDPFPQHALELRELSEIVMRIIHDRFPNTQQVFVSSRIYGGYATSGLNPEPYAYESGFSMKWLVEDQINGDAGLNYRPERGPVVAPWIAWAAYLWADGVKGRSDGLVWLREDFAADGTHPSELGRRKVGQLLLDFFRSEPTARLWFLRPGLGALLGDLNGDRRIDAADIEALVLALFDPEAFAQRYPGVNRVAAGDLNQDGRLDANDIQPFIELLFRD